MPSTTLEAGISLWPKLLTPMAPRHKTVTLPSFSIIPFGWKENAEEQFLNKCQIKSKNQMMILKSLFLKTTHLTESFEYIGLNVEGEPDLIISFMLPEQVMNLIKVYNAYQGNNLDVSLSSMMSICGGIAVRTLIEDTICFSFGCDESRQFARLGNDRVAVGVPKRLFTIFAGEVLV